MNAFFKAYVDESFVRGSMWWQRPESRGGRGTGFSARVDLKSGNARALDGPAVSLHAVPDSLVPDAIFHAQQVTRNLTLFQSLIVRELFGETKEAVDKTI